MEYFIEIKTVGDNYMTLNLDEKFAFSLQNESLIELDRNKLNEAWFMTGIFKDESIRLIRIHENYYFPGIAKISYIRIIGKIFREFIRFEGVLIDENRKPYL